MEKLIALGTGYAVATKCYTTSFLVSNTIEEKEEYFMIDAGGGSGVLTQLEKSNITVEQIHHMFLSHAHTDHIIGAVWMLRMIGHRIQGGSYEGNFHIYCLEHIANGLIDMCRLMLPPRLMELFGERIIFHCLADGMKFEILGRETTFFDAGSKKTPQYGVHIALQNGKTFVYLGDEPYRDCSEGYAKGADYFMHEAVCVEAEEERFHPHKIAHSTVRDAAEFAEQLNAGCLILHHTSDHALNIRKETFTSDAKRFFRGNVWTPDDLDVMIL